ncbi:MAG: hypothetical protein DCC55_39700 [Chloroflexi bacterium]|nr:MAG: hypothetical protein DCC55_39700 [Chloroflexota bacterium]
MFRSIGRPVFVKGYDIHPAMKHLSGGKNVSFHYADFTHTEPSDKADLVIMFDVIEHVPGPLGFLRAVSERARFVALHIPLDDSWLLGMRNLWKRNLLHPGHLLVLNVSSAINLLTFSGLRVEDYSLTPVFRAPFGTETRSQRLLNPIRRVLYRISPYVLQRTLGGVSLMVLATNAYAFHRP